MAFKFPMGEMAKDVVTGFTGIITARVEFLTGCNQYVLNPPMKKGDKETLKTEQFDENRLVIVPGKAIRLPEDPAPRPVRETGGPQPLIQRTGAIKSRN